MINDSHLGEQFKAIPTASLLENTTPKFDIFIKHNNTYPLLVIKNSKINFEIIKRIKNNGIELLYIHKHDTALYEAYNIDNTCNTDCVIDNHEIKDNQPLRYYKMLYTSALDVIKKLFEEKITEESVNQTKEVAEALFHQILSDEKAFSYLMKVLSYDNYIYTHSINVCLYSLIIGKKLDLDQEKLQALAEGALFHNIGKTKIDKNIINKNGKLTIREFQTIRLHPLYSREILEENGEQNEDVLAIVAQHHEKLNGTGYPDQIDGTKINYLAQIVTVADIFDALTTKRPYKKALDSYEAFSLMYSRMKNEINIDIVKKFIQCFKG